MEEENRQGNWIREENRGKGSENRTREQTRIWDGNRRTVKTRKWNKEREWWNGEKEYIWNKGKK